MSVPIDRYVEMLRAVGEPNRLRILALLRHGELAVGELVQITGQSQPRLSHHLKALSSNGLVERLPEGSWVFYGLPASGEERQFLDSVFSQLDCSAVEFSRDVAKLKDVQSKRALAAASYFEEIAKTWDTIRALHFSDEAIETALLNAAGTGPFERIVDIGTGTGRMLALFADRAGRLDGIDFSHRMLTVARANLESAGISHAHVRHGSASALPYDDGSTDLVIIHQVLHYIDDPKPVIREAARILKPGGQLLVVDFAPHSLEFLRDEHGHRRLGIRENAIDEWFSSTGLRGLKPLRFRAPDSLSEGLEVRIWSGLSESLAKEAVG
ncbi:MAG: metalloregulator ArsR/SmtB family transcription factor [Pseudomonadota bacterium]